MTLQTDLFGSTAEPEGLDLDPAFTTVEEQADIVKHLAALPLAPFEFHGWEGARRIVSFGLKYDFSRGRVEPAEPMPVFLRGLADRAAGFAGVSPATIAQALITEYQSGAGIGWHLDRPPFEQVIGLSFGAPCGMRFRKQNGSTWMRRTIELEPGSAYLLDGPARWDWEHSISPMAALRYSITFRTLRTGGN